MWWKLARVPGDRACRRSRSSCSCRSSTCFGAVIENDLLAKAEAEILLEELAIGFEVYGKAIPMVEAADVGAAGRELLRLILQLWTQFGRSLIPLRFLVQLDLVAVGILAHESRSVREVAIAPSDIKSRVGKMRCQSAWKFERWKAGPRFV